MLIAADPIAVWAMSHVAYLEECPRPADAVGHAGDALVRTLATALSRREV